MNTITKNLKFLSITGQIDGDGNPILEPVEKQASFYKLSQTDPRQCRLFFMMRPLYQELKVIGEEKATMIANPSIMFDLAMYAIDALLIIDDKFTETDKKEFKNDTFAVLDFAEWFLEEATPFFLKYFTSYRLSPKTVKEPVTSL